MPKRDLEIFRNLLIRAEAASLDEDDEFTSGHIQLSDPIATNDAYHLILLRDAGLIEGKEVSLGIFRVTNSGHDYLDAIRDEGIWAKTKTGIAGVGGATLGIVKDLAVAYLRQKLAEKTGITL